MHEEDKGVAIRVMASLGGLATATHLREKLVESGAIARLMQGLKAHSTEREVVLRCARALAKVGTTELCRKVVVKDGALSLLTEARKFFEKDSALKSSISYAIAVLSG